MSRSAQMDEPLTDLTLALEIERISRERRSLARSVDASAIVFHRALFPDPPEREVAAEDEWPRVVSSRSGFAPGVRALLVASMAVLLAVVARLYWPLVQPPRADAAAGSPGVIELAALSEPREAERSPVMHPLVIHLQAIRPCRVRVVVDGAELEWRALRPGDELFSRPEREVLIQSDDGGALSTTVNGRAISLGSSGQPIAVRLTSERPFPEPVSTNLR
jgi:hypothetical protein